MRMARSYVSAVTEAAQEAMAQERTTRGDGWPARSKLAKTRSASSKGADEWCVVRNQRCLWHSCTTLYRYPTSLPRL